MIISKQFRIFVPEISNKTIYTISIQEQLNSTSSVLLTWPGSILLASFIACNPSNFTGHSVLEIGAGTGLPSILCGLIGARIVYISDRSEELDILRLIEKNVSSNGLNDICHPFALNWKEFPMIFDEFPKTDIILGADIFYSSEDFDDILYLIYSLLMKNPNAVAYTTYQQRSTNRSIKPLLDQYSLVAQEIPRWQFLHMVHETKGYININPSKNSTRRERFQLDEIQSCYFDEKLLTSFDDITLLKITIKV